MNIIEWFDSQGIPITSTGAVHVIDPITKRSKTLFVHERPNGIVVISETVHSQTYRNTYKTRERALRALSARGTIATHEGVPHAQDIKKHHATMKAKRPTLRKHDRVTLAPHKSVIPPYDGKPYVLRDTVLTVSHLTGTGTKRSPWHVVVTDGTHFWHLEPDDVVRAEELTRHHAKKKTRAQLDREIAEALAEAEVKPISESSYLGGLRYKTETYGPGGSRPISAALSRGTRSHATMKTSVPEVGQFVEWESPNTGITYKGRVQESQKIDGKLLLRIKVAGGGSDAIMPASAVRVLAKKRA